jgi:hypothetical protein
VKQKLSLETLGDLDNGTARQICNSALARAVDDLDDRGDDGKERQVEIVVGMKQSKDGGFVVTTVSARAKLPVYRSRATVSEINRADGHTELIFNDLAPNDPRQKTIDEA